MLYLKLYVLFIPVVLLFLLCPFFFFPTGIQYISVRRPYVTYALLALLLTAGVGQFLIGPFLLEIPPDGWTDSFAFSGGWDEPWRFWTYAFCHHNVFEAIAALIMFYYFGPPLEDRLKWHRMLALYLVGCAAAPLLYLVLREKLNLPAGEFYGFPIPLTFLLGVFFILMPWSDLRIRYFYWFFYVFPHIGTFGLASVLVIAGYLFFEIKIFLPEEVPSLVAFLTPDAVLLLSNGLIGFLVGGLFFGFKRIFKGEDLSSQNEGRVQRSLQRAIQKASAKEAVLEAGTSVPSALSPELGKKEESEAVVPALLPPSSPLQSDSPPGISPPSLSASRFSGLLTETPPTSSVSPEPSVDAEPSLFGLRPVGEEFSSGHNSRMQPRSPEEKDEEL
jgi:membrane associated rhomboid family serine protease